MSNHHHTSHAELRAACAYMQTANVSLVYLLGHWCDVTLGAKQGYSTPQLYHKMLKLPGCGSSVLRYVHGHLHENKVWARSDSNQAVGYIGKTPSKKPSRKPLPNPTVPSTTPLSLILHPVGGSGIDDQSRELGFGWIDSRDDRDVFAYFRLQRKAGPKPGKGLPAFDNFEEIVGCIEALGVDQCLHYAEIWSNSSLPPPQT